MSDFLIDPITKDLDLSSFDIKLTEEDDGQSLAQRLEIKLSFFLGEWFLSTTFGVPYFQRVFIKGVTKSGLDKIFKDQILDTPDVVNILDFVSSLDRATRKYTISTLRVQGSTGEIAEINNILIGV